MMIKSHEIPLVKIIISWNKDRGFYHKDIQSEWLSDVIQGVALRYELKTDFSKPSMSESDWLFMINGMNNDIVRLEEEDGSDWKW